MTGSRRPLWPRVRDAALRSGARSAVVSSDGALTYDELIRRSAALAAVLAESGGPVMVFGHKEPAMLVAIVAALQLGRTYVPVEATTPVTRIIRMLEIASPGHVVAAQPLPSALEEHLRVQGIPHTYLDALASEPDRRAPRAPSVQERTPAPDDIAYVIFTSGTTGQPKGVRISHAGLEHFADWLLDIQRLRASGEVFLDQAPYSFDLSVLQLFAALLTGGTLWAVSSDEISDPRRFFARLQGSSLTVWVSTPSFARFCLAEPTFREEMLPALRRIVFCGETLPGTVAQQLLRRFPAAEVWNLYGPTEATVAVTGVQVTSGLASLANPLPVGRPGGSMRILIAEPGEPVRPVPDGEPGEIVIAGPQVAHGYLQAQAGPFLTLPDGTRAYRTGDLGHIGAADGQLYCHGRLDRQIKLRGYRLELDEIEALLLRIPGLLDGAVIPVERQGVIDHLIAVVVPSAEPGHALPAGDLALTRFVREQLGRHLPAYALPRMVRRLDRPPLTPNGKLDRAALKELLQ